MWVERLGLEDFRNYEREAIELGPDLNVVVGRNAQGKTNLLEAVYCLGGRGSPRGPDTGLIREGAEHALLHADVELGARALHLDIELRPGRGIRALVNRTPISGTRALRDLTTSVFFGPDELSLIKGSPEGRRRYLDELVVKLRPAREALRREWERALKQRNALLKSAPKSERMSPSMSETLEIWDQSLCRTGAALASARLEALASLLPLVRKRYEAIAGRGRIDLAYSSTWLPSDLCEGALTGAAQAEEAAVLGAFEKGLERLRSKELERGVSLVGPHRDDVVVSLAASGEGAMMDARVFASQGDQRTSALALKLAEHDLLTEALGDKPVLLLDDVLSELDPARRAWLIDAVREAGQVLLSSADPEAMEHVGNGHVIEISSGRVRIAGDSS